jgi:hypothetical protein
MKTKPNDPINPILKNTISGYGGLTKLEHFAGLALSGMLAHSGTLAAQEYAEVSVLIAKQLIEELNKSDL